MDQILSQLEDVCKKQAVIIVNPGVQGRLPRAENTVVVCSTAKMQRFCMCQLSTSLKNSHQLPLIHRLASASSPILPRKLFPKSRPAKNSPRICRSLLWSPKPLFFLSISMLSSSIKVFFSSSSAPPHSGKGRRAKRRSWRGATLRRPLGST